MTTRMQNIYSCYTPLPCTRNFGSCLPKRLGLWDPEDQVGAEVGRNFLGGQWDMGLEFSGVLEDGDVVWGICSPLVPTSCAAAACYKTVAALCLLLLVVTDNLPFERSASG